nr:MAG TPA: hypothetical protein [Caudoviricetes sp.]
MEPRHIHRRLRQDSNLQPRDYVTVSDMWTQAA